MARHPLRPLALLSLRRGSGAGDAITVASELTFGSSWLGQRLATRAAVAVARELLFELLRDGQVRRDRCGWFYEIDPGDRVPRSLSGHPARSMGRTRSWGKTA